MGELVGRIRAQLAEQRLQRSTHGGQAGPAAPATEPERRQGRVSRIRPAGTMTRLPLGGDQKGSD